jgi:glycopeptide antibiotics resistance protein
MKRSLHRIAVACLIAYTAVLAYWMLLGFGRSVANPTFMYNLIPFETISRYLHGNHFNPEIRIINLAGNVAVFLPFGMLLPLVFGGKRMRSYGIFLAGLFVLETLQLVTRRGSFDVDVFLLNSAGFFVGYTVYHAIKRKWGSQ